MSLTVNNNLLQGAQNSWNAKTKLSTADADNAPIPSNSPNETAADNLASDTYTPTLSSTVASLQSSVDNLASMLNRIRDKGLALQSTELLQMQITNHPHLAIKAQANISAQDVAALLK